MRALELLDVGELAPLDGPSQLWSEDLRHPTQLFGLTMQREALYEAIDARVEAMLAAGAREQVLARAMRPAHRRRRARRSASRICWPATSRR